MHYDVVHSQASCCKTRLMVLQVLRCAFGGGDAKSRDALSAAPREVGTNKASTNNKVKGALVPKEEELLDGGWPGGGLYARAAEVRGPYRGLSIDELDHVQYYNSFPFE